MIAVDKRDSQVDLQIKINSEYNLIWNKLRVKIKFIILLTPLKGPTLTAKEHNWLAGTTTFQTKIFLNLSIAASFFPKQAPIQSYASLISHSWRLSFPKKMCSLPIQSLLRDKHVSEFPEVTDRALDHCPSTSSAE